MLPYIIAFLAFIYYLTGSSLLYLSLHENAWDLGIFNQVLYNTASFNPFAYSFRSFGNYLGDHFSPILLFIAPLAEFRTSLPLLALQAAGLALAVLVLYFLAFKALGNKWLSLAVAFSFAVNPFTLNIANFDFHPDFAFPLFFFAAFYFLLKKRYRLTFICIVLLQLIREDAFLLIIPFCLLAFFGLKKVYPFQKDKLSRKLAVSCLAFTLVYSASVILVIMPLLRDNGSSPLAEHYPYLGRSIGEIGLNIVKNPLVIVEKLTGVPERTTFLKFFGSTGFLALLSPILLLLSAPIFLAHFLSVVSMRINLEGHYSSQLLAFMYVAVTFGLSKISNSLVRLVSMEALLSVYLVVVSAISFTLFSPFPPSKSANIDRFTVTKHHQMFFQLIKLIPNDVSVSAQTNLVPALAFRKDIYEFPDLREADYVFLDEKGPVSGQSITWGYYQKKDNLPKCGYRLIKDEDGLKIYKKDPSFNLLRLLGC